MIYRVGPDWPTSAEQLEAALAREPFIVREPGSGTRAALEEYLERYRLQPVQVM